MNLTELITSSNARGHIGVRGTLTVIPDDNATHPVLENVLVKAEALDLIRLVSAWRSTEDDLPEHRDGPVDRRVYALTHKGWDLKINARDTLSSYKASILAEALAAHYGELEEPEVGLRYPEEAFENWQSNTNVYTSAHQHPRGPMPNITIDPPLHAVDTWPRQELEVPDDHFIMPNLVRYEVFRWEGLLGIFVILLVAIGWWLS